MEFSFQASKEPYCRLLSIRSLAYIEGLIEYRKTVSIATGLKIECSWETSVGFLSGRK